MTADPVRAVSADRDYGRRVIVVEPGGNEPIPAAERHGRPRQLFWTWTSPNLEFATVFVGVLSVQAFGLTFPQAVAAVLLGNGLAALAHGVLSARGPAAGVPQMVLGRLAFGYRGNALPAGLMTVTSGLGWFAVKSVSAAFALNSLTGLPRRPGSWSSCSCRSASPSSGTTWCRSSSGSPSPCSRWCSRSRR